MDDEFVIFSTREALGLPGAGLEFDTEVKTHIRSALGILLQNGVGKPTTINSETTWGDVKDATQVNGNQQFELVKSYVFAKTKILFDPPPPSNVAFYDAYTKELEWRLKIAYERDNGV